MATGFSWWVGAAQGSCWWRKYPPNEVAAAKKIPVQILIFALVFSSTGRTRLKWLQRAKVNPREPSQWNREINVCSERGLSFELMVVDSPGPGSSSLQPSCSPTAATYQSGSDVDSDSPFFPEDKGICTGWFLPHKSRHFGKVDWSIRWYLVKEILFKYKCVSSNSFLMGGRREVRGVIPSSV